MKIIRFGTTIFTSLSLLTAALFFQQEKDLTNVFALEQTSDIIPTEIKELSHLSYGFQGQTSMITKGQIQTFPDTYSNLPGVFTFRGNHLRDSAAYGLVNEKPSQILKQWEFKTGSSPRWGGGAGWTGQPAIVKWANDVKMTMNINGEFKNKENFVEVIYASLDGKVYFFDIESGKQSRPAIDIKNPIKGSVSIDPRGYPLLYVGQGIPQTGNSQIGFRIYSLIDGKLLHFVKGLDSYAYRGWGAFDSAALVNRNTDTLFLGGENGLFYSMKLNTKFDAKKKTISVNPQTVKYRYKIGNFNHQGIENSVASYKNMMYFTDNGGTLQGIDIAKMKPVWALGMTDDSDASIVIEPQKGIPFLYTGTEVDKQGSKGNSILRKVNGLTGKVMWKKEIPALTILGENPVNGGLLATPIIGKNDISNQIIFTIARYKTMSAGLMLSLDKETGKEIWRREMSNYAWSSPVAVYDKKGNSYIVQCDSVGTIYLIKGKTGEIIQKKNFYGSNIEASPAIYNNTIVIANRGGRIFSLTIK
ncbi:PQQ-like beta-propeller repeat protein [Pseudoneobacillus rhizosphaerae]|uniref:Outer membrane protein assembly factor BamB n=1 Tax=Pseudoneobacillus rhizosphaerae TaxID=2880968 RepID=A0A9C7LCD3_9BACI|nr:PQQ-like beta-propeller repeat protein [Pseudoneobacillus rhizosphaerae]CAG9610167.1 Outer membrane protein assembly factor BamB [Pseudoneobacillus rhizosphaerae]